MGRRRGFRETPPGRAQQAPARPARPLGPSAKAWRPRVPSRPDTQPQTCGLSRPHARLRWGRKRARLGGAEGRGGGASLRTAARGRDRKDWAAAELCATRWNRGPGGVGSPGKGARRGGRSATAAPIGPGSCLLTGGSTPSRAATPRLVRRRPEGRGELPLAGPAQPVGSPGKSLPAELRDKPRGQRVVEISSRMPTSVTRGWSERCG